MGQRKIGKCDVCQPIEKLIKELKARGYEVVSENCRDFHFNEVEVKMTKSPEAVRLGDIKIDNIESKNDVYVCKCHWSTVKIA